jgi:hypothetical protein
LDYEAKILLEVVPWVDAKLSRGWTKTENRYQSMQNFGISAEISKFR